MKGTLIWFNPEKHHGFIRTEDGERLRVETAGFAPGHQLGDRCRGTAVAFDRIEQGEEPLAVHVTVMPVFPERRARARKR
jgi:cold shock CspA family protein